MYYSTRVVPTIVVEGRNYYWFLLFDVSGLGVENFEWSELQSIYL